MINERWFPIQGEHGVTDKGENYQRPAGQVPWGIAEAAYKAYSRKYGVGQSLQRLAERGGFGWSELVALLRNDDDFPKIPLGES